MSVTLASKGGRIVREKRRPLRDDELLRERDRSMLAKYLEGHSAREVGRVYGISESMVCRRLRGVPQSVWARVQKDVKAIKATRLRMLREEAEAANA